MRRGIPGKQEQQAGKIIKAFLDKLGSIRDGYTIREAIKLTEGQFGARYFAAFFRNA